MQGLKSCKNDLISWSYPAEKKMQVAFAYLPFETRK